MHNPQPYSNLENEPVEPVVQPVVQPIVAVQPIQPVIVQPVPVQQVVVSNAPLYANPRIAQLNTPGQFILKQTPVWFWFHLVGSILGGIALLGIGFYLYGIIAIVAGVLSAFTMKDLLIRAENDKIFIGWGPLKCCTCCLQEINLEYRNVQSFGEYPNQCWYPLGFKPAFFSPAGDCCLNFCFKHSLFWCCCANAFWYNAACVLYCCVLTSPELIVFTVINPITCCCYTAQHIGVSLPSSRALSDFLSSRNLQKDRLSSFNQVTTQTVVSVSHSQPVQVQQPMQRQIQANQPQYVPVPHQQVQLEQVQMSQEQVQQQRLLDENNEGISNQTQDSYITPNYAQPQDVYTQQQVSQI